MTIHDKFSAASAHAADRPHVTPEVTLDFMKVDMKSRPAMYDYLTRYNGRMGLSDADLKAMKISDLRALVRAAFNAARAKHLYGDKAGVLTQTAPPVRKAAPPAVVYPPFTLGEAYQKYELRALSTHKDHDGYPIPTCKLYTHDGIFIAEYSGDEWGGESRWFVHSQSEMDKFSAYAAAFPKWGSALDMPYDHDLLIEALFNLTSDIRRYANLAKKNLVFRAPSHKPGNFAALKYSDPARMRAPSLMAQARQQVIDKHGEKVVFADDDMLAFALLVAPPSAY